MNDVSFDTLTRHAAGGASRRTALMTLGVAGLAAAFAGPSMADAKNKNKKSASKKAKQKCQKQIGQCMNVFTPLCEGIPGCLAQAKGCCALAGNCDVVGVSSCLFA